MSTIIIGKYRAKVYIDAVSKIHFCPTFRYIFCFYSINRDDILRELMIEMQFLQIN